MQFITHHNRKWWIFIAMAAALSVAFLDQTSISVALPAMQKDLGMTNVTTQWVINAYLVSLAAIIIFGGKLGDVYGHKCIFLIGIIIFVLASIFCAAAPNSLWLIASRAIQGVGGAFMIPVTGVIIAQAFPENERGKAMGLYVGVASLFLSLGPLLAGLIIQYFNWPWVFWVNVPVSVFSIMLTLVAVPKTLCIPTSIKPLDWWGFITFSIFITALTIALMEGVDLGWQSKEIIALFIIASIFLIAFLIIEMNAADPIIYLPLFLNKSFLGASLCLLLFTSAFSSSVFWAILLQNVMDYSSLATGLFYLPVTIPVMFMAPLGGKLRDRMGPRAPTIFGTIISTLGAFWIAGSVFYGNYFAMFPGFLLFGLGPSLVYSSVMATTLSSVQLSQMGMASGIANGIRQIGRLLGVALIGSIISNVEQYLLIHRLAQNGVLSYLKPQKVVNLLGDSALANKILLNYPNIKIQEVITVLKSAYTFAFSVSMVFTGLLVILTLFASFLLPNKPLVSVKP